jgi:uncharacterized protein YjhX (UPF0386 family)
MARGTKKKNIRTEAGDEKPDRPDVPDRDEELSEDKDVADAMRDLYKDIEKGFENSQDRTNNMMDYWEIYNCKLGENQYYSGNSKIYLPIVHDAVKARVTRFTNQIFPQAGRFIEVTTEDGTIPHAEMSLIEHYIRRCKLRTQVVPALVRNGDVEGQYNVYCGWQERKRHVVYRSQKPIQVEEQEALADPDDKVDDIVEETVTDARPYVEVLADSDVLVLPHTTDSVADALASGGSVTILRRWSKAKIKQMKRDGHIREDVADDLLDEMSGEKSIKLTDKSKTLVDAAGIKTVGGGKHALIYESWTELELPSVDDPKDKQRRLCRIYLGGLDRHLSCKRNPYWSDKCPLFSVPVENIQGVFKGTSLVHPTKEVQYYANDTINEAADSSMYSMMPIVLTDPEKNPRIGSMVLSLAAVWECDPQSTTFAKFPDIWKSGFEIVASCKQQIMQTLSVSPASITQSSSQKAKPSQADVAREQQVDILTTADACTVLEEGILTPVVNFMLELDHQYRNDDLLIRQFGEKGLRAKMEWVPPVQMDRKYSMRWFGVEQARTQQQIQLQIAGLNIVKSIPPEQYQGHRLNLVPAITMLVENLFGPRLAPLIFEDLKSQMTIEPDLENQWLAQGHDLPVHPMDDDPQHLQAHQQVMQAGDPVGNVAVHMRRHMMQMQLKQMAQMQQAVQGMVQPGQAPGGGARPGAQPKAPRGGQGPAGMVPRDQIGPQSGQPPALRNRGG